MLLDRLRAHQLDARKGRDAIAAGLLTTLISEGERVGKDKGNRPSTDEEVLGTVRKFLKNAEEVRDAIAARGDAEATAKVHREITILTSYLPQQMSEADLRAKIEAFKADNPGATMRDLMPYLKANFAGLYDGKLANQIAKDVLA